MLNKKIFRLAKHMLDLLPTNASEKIKNPGELQVLIKNQKNLWDYYSQLGPDGYIKLVIATWGFFKNFSESEIENMFNDAAFAVVFHSDGDEKSEECDMCNGNGYNTCEECNGSGHEECGECDGNGDEVCGRCDGVGEVSDDEGGMVTCDDCDGNGKVECSNCDGEGEVTCSQCAGDGSEECLECDGVGEISDGTIEYHLDYIVCWDKQINQQMEIKDQTSDPLMPQDRYYRNDKILVLGNRTNHAYLNVEFMEIYVVSYFTNRPPSNFKPQPSGFFSLPEYDITHLLE